MAAQSSLDVDKPTPVPIAGLRPGIPVLVFMPFAAGYFLSYLFRTINGPLSDRLVAAFHLGTADLGLLTSVYFLTFAAFQIPMGLLIDRYGPRRVQFTTLLCAVAGSALFVFANGPLALFAGRALIGLGCSASLVTGLKACALWLPAERRPMGTACLVMCGGLGAMASTVPLDLAAGLIHWRMIFAILSVATLGVAVLVWVFVPDTRADRTETVGDTFRGLQEVVSDRRFWRIAPVSAIVVGSAFAIHGLWAARWLTDLAHMNQAGISLVLLAMGGGLTAGGLLFGRLAAWYRHRGLAMTTLFGDACIVFVMVEAALIGNIPVTTPALFVVFAIFGAVTVLSFTVIGELFPAEKAGRANGALNVLHIGAAFAVQAAFGGIVALWPVGADGRPPPAGYIAALTVAMMLQVLAFAWFLVGVSPKRGRLPAHSPTPPRNVFDPDKKRAVRSALKMATVGMVLIVGLLLSIALGSPQEAQMAAVDYDLVGGGD